MNMGTFSKKESHQRTAGIPTFIRQVPGATMAYKNVNKQYVCWVGAN